MGSFDESALKTLQKKVCKDASTATYVGRSHESHRAILFCKKGVDRTLAERIGIAVERWSAVCNIKDEIWEKHGANKYHALRALVNKIARGDAEGTHVYHRYGEHRIIIKCRDGVDWDTARQCGIKMYNIATVVNVPHDVWDKLGAVE